MKKIIIALLACALLAGCSATPENADATGTENTEKENTTESSETPYIALVLKHNSVLANDEYEEKDTESFTSTPKETVEIVINGETVIGTYADSIYELMNYYPTHYYNSETCSFAIDYRNVLVSYSVPLPEPSEDTERLTRDECVTKASDFINSVMEKDEDFDLGDYKIFVTENNEMKAYDIRFVKLIDDHQTNDQALVCVSWYGSIMNYNSTMLGMIDADSEVEFDEALVKIAITNKLNSIYENNKEGYTDITYQISDSMSLILLKNGTLALLCDATVRYTDTNSETNAIISENIQFIIQ